jgi:sulfonate transport system ATP-binding protein
MSQGQGIHLRVSGLSKSFDGRNVLREIDLEVQPGEFLAVVGRSGCGKSTLLRVLAGLESPDAGAVTCDGIAIDGVHSEVRMIFQEARLLPWSTVLSNVSLGARIELRTRAATHERESRAKALLKQVGLADREADWPGRLSGGQKQRVALARGLMSEPRLLLLDEPLGALDALTRLEMQQLIERLWVSLGFTAVLVTHEIQEAVALADRVIVIEDGRIVSRVDLTMARPRVREERPFVTTAATLLAQILGRPLSPVSQRGGPFGASPEGSAA